MIRPVMTPLSCLSCQGYHQAWFPPVLQSLQLPLTPSPYSVDDWRSQHIQTVIYYKGFEGVSAELQFSLKMIQFRSLDYLNHESFPLKPLQCIWYGIMKLHCLCMKMSPVV